MQKISIKKYCNGYIWFLDKHVKVIWDEKKRKESEWEGYFD